MARLVIMYGNNPERTVHLDKSRLVIGRAEEVDIQLGEETVSRHHCAIESQGTRHVLIDLDSTSGTFVDGQKVRSVPLEHGTRIEVGKHTLIYERTGVEKERTRPTSPEATGTGFWTAGLVESSVEAKTTDLGLPPPPIPDTAAETRPGESVDGHKGTMVASAEEMQRIRDSLMVSQKPHVAVIEKDGTRSLLPVERGEFVVGYHEGADYPLPGSRLLGKKQFRIHSTPDGWALQVLATFSKVKIRGEKVSGLRFLQGNEVIELDEIKFKFNEGS